MWGKKKEKAHVHTGFLDDMSEEQTAKLEEFKRVIKENGELTNEQTMNDYYLTRFLRAR